MSKSKLNDHALVRQIITEFKSKKMKPIYCFDGEEEYYLNRLEHAFEHEILSDSERDFNLNVFYGKDADWKNVLNTCMQAPMFGGMQLVIIKEASEFSGLKDIEDHLKKIPPSTHLFIGHKHKKIDGRGTFIKTVQKLGTYHRFESIKEEKVSQWIIDFCTSQHLEIGTMNADLLALNLGNDLQKIANELEKIQLNMGEEKEITSELIEKYIGISKEYNIFEYANAILYRNKPKAYAILNYAVSNPKLMPTTPIIANLFGAFSAIYAYHKLARPQASILQTELGVNYYQAQDATKASHLYNQAQAKEAINILHEMSLKERGVGVTVSDANVHKELVGKLMSL